MGSFPNRRNTSAARWALILGSASLAIGLVAHGAITLKPERVSQAATRKSGAYVKDGLIVGGDRSINEVTVRDVRHAKNGPFERIVFDLEGLASGEPAAIPRAPYFHVNVSPDMNRMVVTVWGSPKLGFDAKAVAARFRKSAVFREVEIFPVLRPDRWSMALYFKTGRPVEAFELKNPTRIIVDVKAGR